jgi:hypothetical protein
VLLKTNVVTGATMAIRRACLHSVLPIPAGWVHDAWLAFTLSVLHGALAVDEPWIAYRVHASQQIGVVTWSPRALLLLVNRQTAAFYRVESRNYQALSAFFRALGPKYAEIAQQAESKAQFLELRAEGRESLRRFVHGVGRSLLERSYQRYGLGGKQAAFDAVGASYAAWQRVKSQ